MKAAIFDPYLDSLGGGERYVMTFASILKKNGWEVDVEWKEGGIRNKLENRLGLDLNNVRIVSNINNGKGYDLCFWLSDGSIPNLSAKKNILHFQVPFHGVSGKSLFNRLKLRKINKVVCNSQFTKKFVDKEYGVTSVVVYPPVNVKQFNYSNNQSKRNIILAVGRFSQLLQAKRQDVLVSVFKEIVEEGLKGWKLTLAGGSDIGGKEYVAVLRNQAKNYPIEIIENVTNEEINNLYAKAKLFWSASGFDIDEEKEPERVEHFGISVVEAMAAGCVPLVINKGGFREIIIPKVDGILWNTKEELKKQTRELLENTKKRIVLAKHAQKNCERFSQQCFENEILKIIQ